MKVVLLAGGLGTRISEESQFKPKPMIEIGEMPIMWHIMKLYSFYGHNEFIICCGYKSHYIKEYFSNYFLRKSDVTFDFRTGKEVTIHSTEIEPWKVTLVDTGLETMTGGRLKRVEKYLEDDETFMMTYGDGVSDVDINKLICFHKDNNKTATMTVIRPGGRYGVVSLGEDSVSVNSFLEKPVEGDGWINGGFFVLNNKVFDYIESDEDVFEKRPLETMAKQNELCAYKHTGYWQSMDSMREKNILEKLWSENRAPWKVWG